MNETMKAFFATLHAGLCNILDTETVNPPGIEEMQLITGIVQELIILLGISKSSDAVRVFLDLAYSGVDDRLHPRYPRTTMERLVVHVKSRHPMVWRDACDHFGVMP